MCRQHRRVVHRIDGDRYRRVGCGWRKPPGVVVRDMYAEAGRQTIDERARRDAVGIVRCARFTVVLVGKLQSRMSAVGELSLGE